jgi:hypothetical protein
MGLSKQPNRESRTPLTRTRRRLLFGGLIGAVWGVLAVTLWGPSQLSWKASGGGAGIMTRTFGALGYLAVTTTEVTLGGGRAAGSQRSWRVSPARAAATAAITVAVTFVGAVGFSLGVRRLPLLSRCDECGYDLRGLASARCPECGTPTGTPT